MRADRGAFGALRDAEPAEALKKKEAFLTAFRGASDGQTLANRLMVEALGAGIPEHVDAALLVGVIYGFTDESVDSLREALRQDWHSRVSGVPITP